MTPGVMDPDRARLIGKELQVHLSSAEHSLYFHGTSMLPFLQEGDLVIVRPIAWDELRRGDIVTYRNGDKFPTHRVSNKRADRLSLRCDGRVARKFHVKPDDILGRAEVRFRDGHWITTTDPEWRRARRRAMARVMARSWKRALRNRLWPARQRER